MTKICTAVSEGRSRIDTLERDIQNLFKFLMASSRRSTQYKDKIHDPRRENDFALQQVFPDPRNGDRFARINQSWLDRLLYPLHTAHEYLLRDADKHDGNAAARTYKYFMEDYAIQIWKAAPGHEFFFNDRIIDLEGDTQSCIGVNAEETGSELIWMTTEDPIHLIMPITPQIAIVFYNDSRFWDSPFADALHGLRAPFPENGLSAHAPHTDVVDTRQPIFKRGKKMQFSTVTWTVSTGSLSRDDHQKLASYCLAHAKSSVVVQRKICFETAKRHLEACCQSRVEAWKSQGIR